MKKKSKGGGGANWMDTYGDMVTLLLCFFVLLYSMSTISEEKYKAVVMSFNPNAVETPTATLGGDGPSADPEQGEGMLKMDQAQVDAQIDDLYEKLKNMSPRSRGRRVRSPSPAATARCSSPSTSLYFSTETAPCCGRRASQCWTR